jgi:hypothetical protein
MISDSNRNLAEDKISSLTWIQKVLQLNQLRYNMMGSGKLIGNWKKNSSSDDKVNDVSYVRHFKKLINRR